MENYPAPNGNSEKLETPLSTLLVVWSPEGPQTQHYLYMFQLVLPLQQSHEVGANIFPILEMQKLRPREVK